MLAGNADAVAQYRAGKTATFGFLVGQVMKAAGGKANPKRVNELLRACARLVTCYTEALQDNDDRGAQAAFLAGGLIEAHHLSKLYSRGVYALRDLSLTIDKGEFLFLTGPSGAGKSTLLRLLLREELPSEGDLKVAGRNLRTLSAVAGAELPPLGRVRLPGLPADPALHRVSERRVRDARARRRRSRVQQRKTFQVLKWVGLQHRMNALPEELSGGEQQRIAIARALVNDPQLVLADEPTGNLDPDLSLEIMNLFREINARGTTVVVATHDRELIRRVGRRAVTLDHGPDRGGRLMRALRYAFDEAVASLWRGRRSGILSTATIAVALFVLGGFLLSPRTSSGSATNGAERPRCRSISTTMRRRRAIGRPWKRCWRRGRVVAGFRVRLEGRGAAAVQGDVRRSRGRRRHARGESAAGVLRSAAAGRRRRSTAGDRGARREARARRRASPTCGTTGSGSIACWRP